MVSCRPRSPPAGGRTAEKERYANSRSGECQLAAQTAISDIERALEADLRGAIGAFSGQAGGAEVLTLTTRMPRYHDRPVQKIPTWFRNGFGPPWNAATTELDFPPPFPADLDFCPSVAESATVSDFLETGFLAFLRLGNRRSESGYPLPAQRATCIST